MFGLFKAPPKNYSFLMIVWLLLLIDFHMPFCIPMILVKGYLDVSVFGFNVGGVG